MTSRREAKFLVRYRDVSGNDNWTIVTAFDEREAWGLAIAYVGTSSDHVKSVIELPLKYEENDE